MVSDRALPDIGDWARRDDGDNMEEGSTIKIHLGREFWINKDSNDKVLTSERVDLLCFDGQL